MINHEISELAKPCWHEDNFGQSFDLVSYARSIEHVVREECAKVCDKWIDVNHVYTNGAIQCAKSIREMK